MTYLTEIDSIMQLKVSIGDILQRLCLGESEESGRNERNPITTSMSTTFPNGWKLRDLS